MNYISRPDLLKGSQDNVSGEIKPHNVLWNMNKRYGILGDRDRTRPSMSYILDAGKVLFLKVSSGLCSCKRKRRNVLMEPLSLRSILAYKELNDA